MLGSLIRLHLQFFLIHAIRYSRAPVQAVTLRNKADVLIVICIDQPEESSEHTHVMSGGWVLHCWHGMKMIVRGYASCRRKLWPGRVTATTNVSALAPSYSKMCVVATPVSPVDTHPSQSP